MRRFVQALVIANIAVVVANKIRELPAVLPQAVAGSLLRTAVIDLIVLTAAFILLLILVLAKFQSDPAWLLAPLTVLVPLSVVSLYLALTSGGPLLPALLRALLAASYVGAFYRLRAGGAPRQTQRSMEATRV